MPTHHSLAPQMLAGKIRKSFIIIDVDCVCICACAYVRISFQGIGKTLGEAGPGHRD